MFSTNSNVQNLLSSKALKVQACSDTGAYRNQNVHSSLLLLCILHNSTHIHIYIYIYIFILIFTYYVFILLFSLNIMVRVSVSWPCLSSLLDFLFLDPPEKTAAVVFVQVAFWLRMPFKAFWQVFLSSCFIKTHKHSSKIYLFTFC